MSGEGLYMYISWYQSHICKKAPQNAKADVSSGAKRLYFDLHLHLHIRGAFGKFLAWSFISVTDLQPLSCLISF